MSAQTSNWNQPTPGPHLPMPASAGIRAINTGTATLLRYAPCISDGYDDTKMMQKVKRPDADAPITCFVNIGGEVAQNKFTSVITPLWNTPFLGLTDESSPTAGQWYGPKKNTDAFTAGYGPFNCIFPVTGWPYMAVLIYAGGSSIVTPGTLNLTYSSEHSEAANTAYYTGKDNDDVMWDQRLPPANKVGLKITIQLGEAYYESGNKTLYGYYADMHVDEFGRIVKITRERRQTIDAAVDCTS